MQAQPAARSNSSAAWSSNAPMCEMFPLHKPNILVTCDEVTDLAATLAASQCGACQCCDPIICHLQ